MSTVLTLIVRALAGGSLVVVFSLVSEAVKPKSLGGLFGAAPAVAIAALTVTVVSKGDHAARESSVGMIAGGAALLACCLLTVALISRTGGLRSAALGVGPWLAVAGVLYLVVLT